MTKYPLNRPGFGSHHHPVDPPHGASWTRSQIAKSGSPLGLAIREAMVATIQAIDHRFDRLPVPVRYRASGSIDAWSAVRRVAGRDGARLTARLTNPNCDALDLPEILDDFIVKSLGMDPSDEDRRSTTNVVVRSAVSQAFWLRQGLLYEPTSALHRLLEESDISDDVPLALLRLPAQALCIVPEPALRDRRDGFKAVMVFEHVLPDGEFGGGRWLTFFVWPHDGSRQELLGMEGLRVYVGDSARSVGEVISAMSARDGPDNEVTTLWRLALDYAVKMLLYLSLDNTPVILERPHSTAPRIFTGMGKRKRLERLETIAGLYDRYVVGPAVLPKALGTSIGNGSGREVCAHWRRGHFRIQAFGPGSGQRRLIFVMPTLVRADRLNT